VNGKNLTSLSLPCQLFLSVFISVVPYLSNILVIIVENRALSHSYLHMYVRGIKFAYSGIKYLYIRVRKNLNRRIRLFVHYTYTFTVKIRI